MKMKRPLDDEDPTAVENPKKRRAEEEEEQEEGTRSFHLDDDLLFEVLKHVDARSLAMASCVSNQWRKTAQDERLWELICTRHCANTGCGNEQLRSVVRALGGDYCAHRNEVGTPYGCLISKIYTVHLMHEQPIRV